LAKSKGLKRRMIKICSGIFKIIFVLGIFMIASKTGWTDADPSAPSQPKKGPNFTVSSDELEPFSIDKKTDPDEKPVLYSDGNMAVGFNDDAQPNVGYRF
jgi:hypothetical protein